MNIFIFILAIAAALFSSIGQFLFKLFTNRAEQVGVGSMVRSPHVLSGIFIYLCYFGLLFLAYSMGGTISVVFPLTSLAYFFTVALGRIFLHEHFGKRVPLGAALIIAGCVLISL